jgi:hypothetical protein
MGQDVGLVLAAAYARHRNHLLPPGIEPLVRRVLRRRRREALSLPTSAMGFLVAEAAWNKQAGRPFDFSAGLEHARRYGLLGQLQIGRRMAAAFDVHLPEDHTDPSLHVLTLRGADRDQ